MMTFQTMYTDAQDKVGDVSAESLVYLKRHINIGLHQVEDALGSFYTEETREDLTEVGVDVYPAPDNYVRMKEIYTVGSDSIRHYIPSDNEIKDEDQWQTMKSSPQTATNPTYVFYRGDEIEFYPTPATAGITIKMRYEASNHDLSYADDSTGSILSLANGGVAVIGNSTLWDDTFIGRYLKIDAFPRWYKIDDVTDTTHLTLHTPYQGVALAADTEVYTIGEVPHIPPATHILPVFWACSQFFSGPKVDATKSKDYMDMYLGTGKYVGTGLSAAKERWSHRSTSRVIKGQRRLRRGIGLLNPNMHPRVIT